MGGRCLRQRRRCHIGFSHHALRLAEDAPEPSAARQQRWQPAGRALVACGGAHRRGDPGDLQLERFRRVLRRCWIPRALDGPWRVCFPGLLRIREGPPQPPDGGPDGFRPVFVPEGGAAVGCNTAGPEGGARQKRAVVGGATARRALALGVFRRGSRCWRGRGRATAPRGHVEDAFAGAPGLHGIRRLPQPLERPHPGASHVRSGECRFLRSLRRDAAPPRVPCACHLWQ
mmetsp:Transcript_107026/g.298057  ORF Transcript_107026/g.298057 Transcript_107026/m.298057 type:complete len:230 (-) Transcript_107026:763-1452(-)